MHTTAGSTSFFRSVSCEIDPSLKCERLRLEALEGSYMTLLGLSLILVEDFDWLSVESPVGTPYNTEGAVRAASESESRRVVFGKERRSQHSTAQHSTHGVAPQVCSAEQAKIREVPPEAARSFSRCPLCPFIFFLGPHASSPNSFHTRHASPGTWAPTPVCACVRLLSEHDERGWRAARGGQWGG